MNNEIIISFNYSIPREPEKELKTIRFTMINFVNQPISCPLIKNFKNSEKNFNEKNSSHSQFFVKLQST